MTHFPTPSQITECGGPCLQGGPDACECELRLLNQVPNPAGLLNKLSEHPAPPEPEDPWQHRSERMRCRTCMWWVPKGNDLAGIGRCRRHSPTMNGFPVVFDRDWCGDHKLNENAAPEDYHRG